MHKHEFTLSALFSSRPPMPSLAAFADEHHRQKLKPHGTNTPTIS
jgi:hypothetical protein